MRGSLVCLGAAVSVLFGAAPVPPGDFRPPPTARRPVVETYHGTRVSEDYRWLEDTRAPEVRSWLARQNLRTRAYFDGLPAAARVRERVRELVATHAVDYLSLSGKQGRFVALKRAPPLQQPVLVRLETLDDLSGEQPIVDPNALDRSGSTSIDWFVPSPDGRLVAVSLSQAGSEMGSVHVYEVASGKALPDLVPRVNGGTAGGSLAWAPDDSGFFYTRYPRPGERADSDLGFFEEVWFHPLGSDGTADRYELGREFPRIAEVELEASEDGRFVLASIAKGDGGESEHFLRGPDGWRQVTRFEDRVVAARLGLAGELYLVSLASAPGGKVLKLAPSAPRLDLARTVVPESEAPIVDILPTRSRLYVGDVLAGSAHLRIFDLEGAPQGAVPLLAFSGALSVPQNPLRRTVRTGPDEIAFRDESYTVPPLWFRLSAGEQPVATALRQEPAADLSDVAVRREWAISKDGTRVPIDILVQRGTPLAGANPALLTGYGGYGNSLCPRFSPVRRLFLEQGGVIAIANLRGGGEFGEPWHRAGNLTHKQNVFDDFAACAERLVDAGYTCPAQTRHHGRQQRRACSWARRSRSTPSLARAVVSYVGIYDMLRDELSPNGAFNVTEYGSVTNAEQFRALHAYSPYHHVVDGTRYPAVLLLAGENDPRVEVWQSMKMAARLERASSSRHPVLLRTSSATGHGIGSALDEIVAEEADAYTFIFTELGVRYAKVSSRP